MGTGIRVTEEQLRQIAELRDQGRTAREIAQITGLGKSTVGRHVQGKGTAARYIAPKGNNAARAGSLYLDHDLRNVMDRLKVQHKLANYGAVLRRAVALLDTVLEYRSRGYHFYLRDSRDTERELKIAD